MPRGLASGITVELNKTNLAAPVYCIRLTRGAGDVFRWADRAVTFDDGGGSVSYEARLAGITGINFSISQAGPIQFQIVNVDGLVTTQDQTKSFLGSKVEILAYLPGTGDYYLLWGNGWSDEVQQIAPEMATFAAYPTQSTPNVQIPRRMITLACSNTFGNIANWVNARDFEGSECPYQRMSTIGFTASLTGAMDGTTDPITFTATWTSAQDSAGALIRVRDYLQIGSEILLATVAAAKSSHAQTITATRARKGTTKATHADASTIKFQSCTYDITGCTARGMYGNNSSDTYFY